MEKEKGGESLEEDRNSGGLDHIYELPATAFDLRGEFKL